MTKKFGFSLIEVMIVVVVIGIMTTTITRLLVRKPADDWKSILTQLDIMTSAAHIEALRTRTTHCLTFTSNPSQSDTLALKKETSGPRLTKIYVLTQARKNNIYTFPPSVKVRAFFMNGVDMFATSKTLSGSVYVTQDGLFQPVYIHCSRMDQGNESKKTFFLEPFLGTWTMKDNFVRS